MYAKITSTNRFYPIAVEQISNLSGNFRRPIPRSEEAADSFRRQIHYSEKAADSFRRQITWCKKAAHN
jgi:hypothetical protein